MLKHNLSCAWDYESILALLGFRSVTNTSLASSGTRDCRRTETTSSESKTAIERGKKESMLMLQNSGWKYLPK